MYIRQILLIQMGYSSAKTAISMYNHMDGRTASVISPFYSLLPGHLSFLLYRILQYLGSGSVGATTFWRPESGSVKMCGSMGQNTNQNRNLSLKTKNQNCSLIIDQQKFPNLIC